jgi:hypothetical protein
VIKVVCDHESFGNGLNSTAAAVRAFVLIDRWPPLLFSYCIIVDDRRAMTGRVPPPSAAAVVVVVVEMIDS